MSTSPLWRRDKEKIDRQTGEPVRFPIIPDASPDQLPQLDFPPRSPDDGGRGEWENFSVWIIYEDDTTKEIPVLARDQDDALNKALELSDQDPEKRGLKIKTTVVHDGIGDVVARLATGVEKYGTKVYHGVGRAARYGARIAEGVGHVGAELGRGMARGAGQTVATYHSVKREYATGRLSQLIEDAGSEHAARRALAKMELKRDYPHIYAHIAWEQV